ncbi:hypothetical protein L218DRAFT_1072428 [Marasmius fiardii PR-910]|nr:hypothetical protein L218DRAFT_1072428 [Marasmius fiardii PR-910]
MAYTCRTPGIPSPQVENKIVAWAGRTLIVRNLKGFQNIIPVTVASSLKGPLILNLAGTEVDPLYDSERGPLLESRSKLYRKTVNNESSEIIRMFNAAFNDFLPEEYAKIDLYPKGLRTEIEINEWMYTDINGNNGAYRTGFAGTQEAYEKAVKTLFNALDRVKGILQGKRYLIGDRLTEADIRLWVTVIRHDTAYRGNSKCNVKDKMDERVVLEH